jgi:hypothetical protein
MEVEWSADRRAPEPPCRLGFVVPGGFAIGNLGLHCALAAG